jgi:hypothetical protein
MKGALMRWLRRLLRRDRGRLVLMVIGHGFTGEPWYMLMLDGRVDNWTRSATVAADWIRHRGRVGLVTQLEFEALHPGEDRPW